MTETAIVAGGCFWGVQYYFDQVPGVLNTVVGYTGGQVDNPTYEQVVTHITGHAEATQITFDPEKISFKELLMHFFYLHDPTQLNRQGPDVGDNYRSAIFYTSEAQEKQAHEVIDELQPKFGGKIMTTVEEAATFWPAEEYHQKYTQKTGVGACHVDFTPHPAPGA